MASLEKKLTEKHWQKNPKAILTKTKFGPKYKWFKYLIIGILFLKILFRANEGFIFVQTFQWIPFEFFFNFRFSSKKSQSQQKLAKKITHFTVLIKKLYSFYKPQVTWHWKWYAPSTQPKAFLTLQIFSKHIFVWNQKNICTVPFLDAQELHSWSTLKANVCIFPYIS